MAETMSMMLRLGQRALGRLPISKQMGSRQCSAAAATAVNKSKISGFALMFLRHTIFFYNIFINIQFLYQCRL